jgi:hypothetical protein
MTRFPQSNTYDLSDENATFYPDDPNNVCLGLGPAGSQVVIHPSTVKRTRIVHSKGSVPTRLPEEVLRSLQRNPAVCSIVL